ncbi:MAG TPA: AMP-binding protein, partial [Hyphomicrobiales bacterium]|nr:AMP-binding protein [Hyphomicrobiales bacterium]
MPKSANLFSELRRHWKDTAKIALETDEGKTYSYRDVLNRTAQLANSLNAAGLSPGDRVAVQVEKSPEALFLYLACLRAGGAYLPLNTAYTPAELAYFLADAQPSLFVCRPAEEDIAADLCRKTGVAQRLTLGVKAEGSLMQLASGQRSVFKDVPRAADDLAAILYTSGTTGRSKGAMLTHGNLSANAHALIETWRFTSDDVLLHAL